MIPYGKQDISAEDIEEVVAVLRSDFLTQGPKVPAFEEALCRVVGSEHAIAVNSATSALHLACLALGVRPGDRVWTSPNTFVASANCALYCGANVDFVDIDPETYNMDAVALEAKLVSAQAEGQLPKVVIPVHFGGQSCDMELLSGLAERFGFLIIEDASHAIGGQYKGRMIGGCQYSDITVFSFHPVKIMTTAEGGICTTNSEHLAKKLSSLRSHGITREPEEMKRKAAEPWYYEQKELGFNYRMTDLQAALGLSQLKRLHLFIERRQALASRYDSLLEGLPLRTPVRKSYADSALHLYVVRLEGSAQVKSKRQVFEELRELGIGVHVHYIPVHTQPYYEQLGFRPGDFPEAEAYYEEALSLPLFYTMTDGQQDRVVEALKTVLECK